MTEDRSWAIFQNNHLLDRRTFAAKLQGKTAKMVQFTLGRELEDGQEPTSRKADWLLMEGLTREEAEKAVHIDRSSLALMEQEKTGAVQRHAARRKVLLATLAARVADAKEAE